MSPKEDAEKMIAAADWWMAREPESPNEYWLRKHVAHCSTEIRVLATMLAVAAGELSRAQAVKAFGTDDKLFREAMRLRTNAGAMMAKALLKAKKEKDA